MVQNLLQVVSASNQLERILCVTVMVSIKVSDDDDDDEVDDLVDAMLPVSLLLPSILVLLLLLLLFDLPQSIYSFTVTWYSVGSEDVQSFGSVISNSSVTATIGGVVWVLSVSPSSMGGGSVTGVNGSISRVAFSWLH